MINYHRGTSTLVASGVFVFGLLQLADVTYAAEVMLINAQTHKCLTIAGGVSTENNVPALQYDCDTHPSRRWRLNQTDENTYQLQNVQTGKCLTIAGGLSTDDNVRALQYDCDTHPSRTWTIRDVSGDRPRRIRNVQTRKCLTIAGGVSTDNNVEALQYECDSHPSRFWTIRSDTKFDDDD